MLTSGCSRLPLEPRRRVAIGRPRWITDLTARPLICVPRVMTKITHRIHGTQIKRHEKTRRPKACGYEKAARRRLLLTLCKRYYVIVLILLKKSNYVEFYVIRYRVLSICGNCSLSNTSDLSTKYEERSYSARPTFDWLSMTAIARSFRC